MSTRNSIPILATITLAALVASLLITPAFAAIVAISGDVTVIAPPPDVGDDVLESNDEIRVFAETQNTILGADLSVDMTLPGSNITTGIISSGTRVSSFFVHFDGVGNNTLQTATGSITFDTDILGVIVKDAQLDSSDSVVGNPSTSYPTGLADRGIVGPQDVDGPTLSNDRRTISFDLEVGSRIDQARIITVVPIPAAVWLFGSGLVALGAVARRRTMTA